MILDLNCPIRTAIFIYILAMIFLMFYKPELITTKDKNILFATSTIFIAIFSYFVLIALSICV